MPRNNLVLGDWNAICDICGLKFKASQLYKNWKQQMVCEKDFETRHPQDFIRGVPDQQELPFTRPETTDTYVSVTYSYGSGTTANTIPDPTHKIVD